MKKWVMLSFVLFFVSIFANNNSNIVKIIIKIGNKEYYRYAQFTKNPQSQNFKIYVGE